MKKSWPMAPLGEVIQLRKQFIEIDDTLRYKRCRVQLHASGVVLRDDVSGLEIKTKKQQVCRSGEFLVAEIDAKLGGYGMVPPDLDGAIVSSHYFLFQIDEQKLDRRFLDFFSRTPAFGDQVKSQGSTNYAAIRPSHVLAYRIPLPPIGEQRRIVARIEALAAKIAEARGLRATSVMEADAVQKSAMRQWFGDSPAQDWSPITDAVDDIENGWSPQCLGRRAEGDEWGVLKVGAVSFGYFDDSENKALPIQLDPEPRYEVKPGDFLMSRANTTSLVGACAVVKETRSKLMLCDKIFRFKFRRPDAVNREYWDHLLKSPPLRLQIETGASGTSPTMKNIAKAKIMAFRVPDHDPKKQAEIVQALQSLRGYIGSLKTAQAATAAELTALLPSVLDKAFKGEL